MSKELIRSWTKEDFKIDWFSGTGAGGQHRNKHQNCVRLTDKETGITVVGQNHRERSRNMKDALTEMGNRLAIHHYGSDKERAPVEEVVRTYNECENRVVDKASGNKSPYKGYDISDDIVNRKAFTQ